MIVLRELKEKDAPLMLEWMHDKDIQKCFKRNMADATLDDATAFIKSACHPDGDKASVHDLHYAIADSESDEYLGTVSLKNIDFENENAEYAIVLRKCAQGKGVAHQATRLILDTAFEKIDLHRVYLNVFANNTAAINLYEKCGFRFEGEFREHFFIDNEYVSWKWYGILKEEYIK